MQGRKACSSVNAIIRSMVCDHIFPYGCVPLAAVIGSYTRFLSTTVTLVIINYKLSVAFEISI